MLGMCVLTSGGDPATLRRRARAQRRRARRSRWRCSRRLGAQLGCEPTNEAVGAARLERLRADATGYLQELWRDAGIEGLVVDEGFPAADHRRPRARSARPGVAVHRVVRIEPWIAEDRDAAGAYDELEDALSARLEAAAGGRRRGVQVGDRLPHRARHHPAERRRRARRRSRAGARTASARRASTPSRCATALLERTLAGRVGRAGVPVHIHSGGGDPDSLVPPRPARRPVRPAQAPSATSRCC